IVEIENARLRERVRRAERGWMIGIPFDLHRTTFEALRQDAEAKTAKGNRGGEPLRLALHAPLRSGHVRNDRLERLPRASGHAGERERRAGELHEIATAHSLEPYVGARGKFIGLFHRWH